MTQREKILSALENNPKGITNYWLCKNICMRYGGRLFELKQEGFDIETIHIKNSKWVSVLIPPDKSLPLERIVFLEEIKKYWETKGD